MGNEIKDMVLEAIKRKLRTLLTIKVMIPVIGFALIIIIVIGMFGAGSDDNDDGTDDEEEGSSSSSASSSTYSSLPTGWWWPIGSEETITADGITCAPGTPVTVRVTRGGRGPSSAYLGITGETHEKGDKGAAIDIADAGMESNKYNVISIAEGKVLSTESGVPDGQDGNGGMGNYVTVDYGNGITATYMHMYNGSITVHVGDELIYGQVIGKVGNSGSSTATHLHVEIKKNGEYEDTTHYLDPNNPRPMESVPIGGAGVVTEGQQFLRLFENDAMRRYLNGEITEYHSTAYIYNYITQDKQYYLMGNDLGLNRNGNYGFGVCFYTCPGSNPVKGERINTSQGEFMNTGYFKDRGYDVRNDANYQKYYESKIPVSIVDSIEQQMVKEKIQYWTDKAESKGVKLTQNQLYAIVDIAYQYGDGGGGINNILNAMKSGQQVTKSIASGFYEYADRGASRWTLFTTGKYTDSSGKEVVIQGTSNASGNTNNNSSMSNAERVAKYSKFSIRLNRHIKSCRGNAFIYGTARIRIYYWCISYNL